LRGQFTSGAAKQEAREASEEFSFFPKSRNHPGCRSLSND